LEENIVKYINTAIELELEMSELYRVFSQHIREDVNFWYRLEIEEKNHAALLKTAREFVKFNKMPDGLLPDNPEILEETNRRIKEAKESFLKAPARELAFSIAYELENAAGEVHFQHFMEKQTDDRLVKIFHELNQADKDHAMRIHSYWKKVLPD